MGRHSPVVLQIPEVCHWNPYIALAERHLQARGVQVVRPALCLDQPDVPPPAPAVEIDPRPDIVHVHWPEMLATRYGIDRALTTLRDLTARGARIVQTVHDLQPHESSPELVAYLHEVDALTSGSHFFSAEHEQQARLHRPKLPGLRTLLPHPAFPASNRPERRATTPGDEVVLGCFGRIRPYKRFAEFAGAFGRTARTGFRLLIAGEPHSAELHQALRHLAERHPQLTYLPGFQCDEDFSALVSEVDWVALPYRRVFSSGVLVAAIQAGRPVLSPRPTGADAYALGANLSTVEPWDDVTAIERWMDIARLPRPPAPPRSLPTWDAASTHLIAFYDQVRKVPRDS
ncbi:glycosyltransferase [Actinosynnema sp. CS-041913]|uniref:glycosyltransferase n=1 Tax=Actinosynnema sp. CS-041913 TaxID=3239917 RepID=UPI003D8BC97D